MPYMGGDKGKCDDIPSERTNTKVGVAREE